MKDFFSNLPTYASGALMGCGTFVVITGVSFCSTLIYVLNNAYYKQEGSAVEYLTFPIALIATVLPIGFILCTIVGSFVLKRRYQRPTDEVMRAIGISFVMNILNIIVIPLVFYLVVNVVG